MNLYVFLKLAFYLQATQSKTWGPQQLHLEVLISEIQVVVIPVLVKIIQPELPAVLLAGVTSLDLFLEEIIQAIIRR